jgi:hypothetical protein
MVSREYKAMTLFAGIPTVATLGLASIKYSRESSSSSETGSRKTGEFSSNVCASLALQHLALGPKGMPASVYTGMVSAKDGKPEIDGESLVFSDSLEEVADQVINSLDVTGISNVSNGAISEKAADVIAASRTSIAAAKAIDTFNQLPDTDLMGPVGDAASADATAMLDQARVATDDALKSGCSNLVGYLMDHDMQNIWNTNTK